MSTKEQENLGHGWSTTLAKKNENHVHWGTGAYSIEREHARACSLPYAAVSFFGQGGTT